MPQTGAAPIKSRSIVPLAIALCAVMACCAGCYQRVTRATGFGADQYSVSEPYQESGKIDDWFWGKPPSSRSGSRLPPAPKRN
ncbi:MAG: hypothetical protein KF699_09685 [Phycisphaeraceae bacterium]|nr:hypothetical protein [Phycisphaeraceae bacterium]